MTRSVDWIHDPVVRRQLDTVEHVIADAAGLGGDCPPFHTQLLSPRSKRLRPALLLLAGRFGRTRREPPLLAAAAGIELLHQATLYHDDIVDEASERRGEPTVHRSCGPVTAAMAGTELLFATGELFAELPAAARRAIGRAGNRLCRGQLREVETLGDPNATIRDRIRVMRDKTAVLFTLGARLGATLAGADDGITTRLLRLGTRFGLCFQLADDLRDLVAPVDVLGRRPGADLRDGVYTLPVLAALRAPGSEAERLRWCLLRLQQRPDEGLVLRALELVRRAGGIAWTRSTLDAWIVAARAEVQALPALADDRTRRSLHALVDQLATGLDTAAGRAPRVATAISEAERR